MSNIRTFNKKSRKGISPVIATVILVAVAVVIAAALAGFSSSLFGTYSSQGAAVVVKDLTIDSLGDGVLSLSNNGNTKDALVSISIPPLGAQTFVEGTADVLPGQSADNLVINLPAMPDNADSGKTVTVKMNFASGAQLTQSVILQ
jgi:flagellin-like protein